MVRVRTFIVGRDRRVRRRTHLEGLGELSVRRRPRTRRRHPRGAVFYRLLLAASRPTTLAERLAAGARRPRRRAAASTTRSTSPATASNERRSTGTSNAPAGPASSDDIASVKPWHVRGVEIRGRAEALDGSRPLIRIHPERTVSWGIGDSVVGRRSGPYRHAVRRVKDSTRNIAAPTRRRRRALRSAAPARPRTGLGAPVAPEPAYGPRDVARWTGER